MTPSRRRTEEPTTRVPAILWWRDAVSLSDIEIRWEVLTQFHRAEAPGLLAGLAGDAGAPGEFHVWEYIPLRADNPAGLSTTNWENLTPSPTGLAPLGLILPASWPHEQALAALQSARSILPGTALLLRVVNEGQVKAWLWDKASGAATPLDLEFEYDPGQLARRHFAPFQPLHIGGGAADLDAERHAPASAPAAPEPAPAPAAPQPAAPVPTVIRIEIPKAVWVLLILLLAGMAGFAVWYVQLPKESATSPPPVQQAPQPRLDLDIRRGADGALDIRWNPIAATLGAGTGSLRITDGEQVTEVPLTAVDLNSGKLLYVPRSANVEVLLSVAAATGPVQEVVRVIGGNPIAPARPAARPSPQTTTSPASPPATEEPTVTRQRFEPRTSASKPAEPSLAAPPPPVQTAQGPAQQPLLRLDRLPEPPSSAPPRPAPSTPQTAARDVVVIPPRPTRQVMPVVPAHLKQMMPQTTVITVRLKVDAQGRVTDAATENATGLMSHLSKLARDAGRQWRFEPATLDGRAIPSEHVIHFKFSK